MAKKRPKIITAVCALLLIGAIFTIPIMFSDIAKSIGPWYPPYLGFCSIIGFISLVGLCKMKKWGIIVYTAMTAINQIVLIVTGQWNILGLILPGIVILAGFSKFNEMD